MEQAMVTKAIPIRNRSKIDQFIIVNGERMELKAFHTKVVSPEIADAFTRECAPHVTREKGGIDEIQEQYMGPGTDAVWLMNATGDPDSPEEVTVRKHTKDGPVNVSVRNPKHEALVIKQEMQGGQREGFIHGKPTAFQMAAIEIRVWPYSRKAFDKTTAEWLLRRDMGQTELMRGCLKRARPPSGNEPNDTWELEDLQLYAMMLGVEKYGASMSTLKKNAARLNRSLTEVIDETKTELLKRLFFRIADQDYPLPNQEQWEAYRDKQKANPSRDKISRVVGQEAGVS